MINVAKVGELMMRKVELNLKVVAEGKEFQELWSSVAGVIAVAMEVAEVSKLAQDYTGLGLVNQQRIKAEGSLKLVEALRGALDACKLAESTEIRTSTIPSPSPAEVPESLVVKKTSKILDSTSSVSPGP